MYFRQVIERMNLGRMMSKFFKTIYSNMYSAVIVNGAKTNYFRLTRSCRQGDPIAMQAFVLAIEPLGNIIRQSRELAPVIIPNQKPKILRQYADDTNVTSSRATDYNEVKKLTSIFESGAGAKLNAAKTEILLIGKWSAVDRAILPAANIKPDIKVLGVWFGPNAKILNCEHILRKIDEVILFWQEMMENFKIRFQKL